VAPLRLEALARAEVQLTHKSLELSRAGGIFDLKVAVNVIEFNWNDDALRQLAVTGYVDGEMEGVGGVTWRFEQPADPRLRERPCRPSRRAG
jgi:hypothetical protein